MMIEISVVIPTYNRKLLLRKILYSLGSQSFLSDKFEVIICDDGSSDGTKDVVNNLKMKLPHVVYHPQNNKGQATARNAGIKLAKGALIAFTDDDCLPHKNWLYALHRCFQEHPEAVGVEGKTITLGTEVTPLTSQIVN